MKELQALLPFLRPYRNGVLAGIGMIVLANALAVGSLEYIRMGVDVLSSPGGTGRAILGFAALSALLALFSGAARFWMRDLLNGISRRVETDLRDELFRRLMRQDAAFYGAHPTGDIMSRATNDLNAVRMTAGPAYMYLVDTFILGAFAVTRMTMIDPRLTLLALLPMLLLPPVTLRFGRVIHARFEAIQEQFGVLSTMAQENLAGQRIVKAYGQEAYQTSRFRALSEDYLERNVRLARTSGLFYPSLGMLAGAALAISLWVGGTAIIDGRVSVGDFVLFLLYLGRLAWPMIALGWVVNLFQRGAASMGRVRTILDAEPTVVSPAAPATPAEVRGAIEVRDVSFRYPGTDRWVLRGVSFTVPAGATAAIVGPTGSGKSTLAGLLVRMWDVTEGSVRVDGVPVTEWDLDRLRAAVAMVPQDTFLFSTTLEENLSMGFDEPDEAARLERVRAAARVAQLDETVSAFRAGYATVLGERGINLSGGQKQRAALARAVARDARILVLDDALSAVDTHTEHEILAGLRTVFAGRTSVIVSHRVTAVMDADLILVLDEGRVVEQGTHADLLRAGGTYAALQRRQLLETQLAADGESGGLLAAPSEVV